MKVQKKTQKKEHSFSSVFGNVCGEEVVSWSLKDDSISATKRDEGDVDSGLTTRIQENSFPSVTCHRTCSLMATQAFWCSAGHCLISRRPLPSMPLLEASPHPSS